jgi:pimeloyl-ACP methyl ester carboxylesterase
VTLLRACLAAGVASLLAGCGGGGRDEAVRPAASGTTVEVEGGVATPYGEGDGRVWVLTRADGDVESVVVYLHGWGATLPTEWHQAWLEHLLAGGSAVVFPQFQDGFDDTFLATPADLRAGLRLGFAALGEPAVPVVAAGFSIGATLSFVYAANADSWGVPAPRSVYSIFPVDPAQVDPGLDLSGLHETRALLLVGDRDVVTGSAGADAIGRMLTSLPDDLRTTRLVRTSDDLVADHEAPTFVESPAVRTTFWEPLDQLVDESRD